MRLPAAYHRFGCATALRFGGALLLLASFAMALTVGMLLAYGGHTGDSLMYNLRGGIGGGSGASGRSSAAAAPAESVAPYADTDGPANLRLLLQDDPRLNYRPRYEQVVIVNPHDQRPAGVPPVYVEDVSADALTHGGGGGVPAIRVLALTPQQLEQRLREEDAKSSEQVSRERQHEMVERQRAIAEDERRREQKERQLKRRQQQPKQKPKQKLQKPVQPQNLAAQPADRITSIEYFDQIIADHRQRQQAAAVAQREQLGLHRDRVDFGADEMEDLEDGEEDGGQRQGGGEEDDEVEVDDPDYEVPKQQQKQQQQSGRKLAINTKRTDAGETLRSRPKSLGAALSEVRRGKWTAFGGQSQPIR